MLSQSCCFVWYWVFLIDALYTEIIQRKKWNDEFWGTGFQKLVLVVIKSTMATCFDMTYREVIYL